MTGIPYNEVEVRVDLDRLRHNWALLNQMGGNAMPVIKSDAYGHGLEAVGRALARAGADALAVGTVGEAAHLRQAGITKRIVALLGPIRDEDYALAVEHSILCFCGRDDQLDGLSRAAVAAGRTQPLPVTIKCDTGMSRLGFSEDGLPALCDKLASLPALRPVMVASHLATADELDQKDFVLEQAACFSRMCDALSKAGHAFEACLANSAALIGFPELRLDVQRPGIALYGCNPFHGTTWEEKGAGLMPAMEVTCPVLQVRDLPKGCSIHYGRTYVAPRDMRVAIVGLGYADAFSRGMSHGNVEGAIHSHGALCVRGRRAPLVGRVCMQMSAVDVTEIPEVMPGDRVHVLGGEGEGAITPEDLAGWWNTITYEVFCLLGLNPRSYV